MSKHFYSFILIAVATSLLPATAFSTVRYVAVGGTGDGSTWAKASGNLQATIEASVAGDEVWVATGTYRPDSLIKSNKPTSRSFFLKDGVSLYGGFAGHEKSKDAREKKRSGKPYDFVYETILNADDNEPDVWERAYEDGTTYRYTWKRENDEIPGTKNNGTHVLFQSEIIVNTTEINGFTLTGANANVWQAKAAGGALYAQGNVMLKACRIVKNSAYFKNQSINDSNTYGGAVFLNGAGNASIEDCLFDSNYSHSSYGNGLGGGVYANNATIKNCEFTDCVASDMGGAVYSDKSNTSHCTMSRCYASSGGALYNTGNASDLTVSKCAGLLGGGIFNTNALNHVKVYDNYADALDYGNDLGGQGGGIYNQGGHVVGAVVFNNKAFRGGGIYVRGGKIVNSTVQNNVLRQEVDTANIGFHTAALSSNVFNTIGNPNAVATNFVAPSAFKGNAQNVEEGTALTLADWSLATGSEFIDKGTITPGVEETTDIAGNARVMGASIDVGAYEYPAEIGKIPTVTLTFDVADKSVRIGVGGSAGYNYSIDWGDGQLQHYNKAVYVTETLKSNTVKIYGDSIRILAATGQGVTAVKFGTTPVLSTIQLGRNQIKAIDVTGMELLTGLYVEENRLKSLDVANNKFMRVLDAHKNEIAGAIDCSAMSKLSKIDVANNQLNGLTLPKHNVLNSVDCASNLLKAIDVTNLTALTQLSCDSNKIASLVLTGLTALEELYAYHNELTALNIEPCTALKTLNASDNKIASINLSKNLNLEGIYLYDNQLQGLDINKNANMRYINVENNQIGSLNTSNQANLSLLIANGNKIASINLSNNEKLTRLGLAHNQLSTIDVSKAKNMSWLQVDNNNLTELNVAGNPYLYWLECDSNKIATLDLAGNTYIQWLATENNMLTTLDLNTNKGLQGLSIQHNPMSDETINGIIDQLQDVNGVEVHANNSAWARQFKYSCISPRTIKRNEAEAKGWIVTEFVTASINDDIATNEDDVIKSVYYTLNGIELSAEAIESGIYMVKDTHANGTITVRKVFIQK